MIPLHDRYAKPALKLVEEDGIEPSPWDFQSPVHTKYTTLPLKLVAVLWASTPLSPQRTASKSMLSGNPFHHGARPITCVSSHLEKMVGASGFEPPTNNL